MGLYNNSKLYFQDQLLPVIDEKPKKVVKKKKKGKKTKAQLLKDKYGDDIIVKLLLLLLGREKKEKKETKKKKRKGDGACPGMRRRKGGGGGFATPAQVRKQREEAEKKAREDKKKAAVAAASVPRPGEDPEDVAERVRQVQIATTDDPVEKALLELTGSMSLPKLEGLQGAIAYLGQFAEPLLRPDLTPGQRTQLEQEVVRNITSFRGPAFAKRFAPDPDKGRPTDIKAGVREGDKFVRRVLQTDIQSAIARGGAPAPTAPTTAQAPFTTDPIEPVGGQQFSPGTTSKPPAKKPRRRRATGQPAEQFRGLSGVTQQGPSLFSYFRGEPQPQPQTQLVPEPAPEGISDVTQRKETPAERLERQERERQAERVSREFGEAIELEEATRRSLDPSNFGRISVGGGTYGELTRKREAERQRVLGKAAEGGRIVAARQPQERTGGLREEVGTEGILEGAFSRINFPAEEQPPPLGNIGGGSPPPDPPSEASEGGESDPQPPPAGTGISPKPKPKGQKGAKEKRNLEKAIQRVRELDFSDYPIGKALTSKGTPSRSPAIVDIDKEREQLIKDLEGLASKTPSKINTLITNRTRKLELGQSIIPQVKAKKSVKIGGTQSLFDRTSEGLIIRKTGKEEKIGDYFPEWNDLDDKTSARAQQIRDDFEWNMRDRERGDFPDKVGYSDIKNLVGSSQDIIRQAEERFNYTLPSELISGLGAQRIRRNEQIISMGEKGISVLTPKGFLRFIPASPKSTPKPKPAPQPASAPPLQPISELEGTIFPIPQEQTAISETSETSETGITPLRSNYRKNKKIVRDLTKKQIEGKLLTATENKKLQETLRAIQDYKTQQAASQAAPDLGSGGETETSGYYTEDSDTGKELAIRFKEPGALEARAEQKFPGDIIQQTFYKVDKEALRGTPEGKVKGEGARKKELQKQQEQMIQEAYEAELRGETFLASDSFLMSDTQKQKASREKGDFTQRSGELSYAKVGTQTERGISGFRKIALDIEAEANRISSVSGEAKAEQYLDKNRSILVDLIKKQLTPKIVSRIRKDGKTMKQAKAEAKKIFADKDDVDIVKQAEELFKEYGEPLSVGTPQYNKFRQAYSKATRKEFGKAVGEETKSAKVNMLDKVLAEVTKITDDKIRVERANILGDSIRQALIDRERAKPNPDESLIDDYELTKKTDFLDYERFGITSADAIKGANFSKKVVDKYKKESKKAPQPKTKPATPLPFGLDTPQGTEEPPPIDKPKKGKRPRPESEPVTAPEPELLQASIETQATTGIDPDIIRKQRELELLRRRKEETGFALPPTPQGTQPTLPGESLEVVKPFDVSIEQPDLGDVGFDYDVEQDVEQGEEEDFGGYF